MAWDVIITDSAFEDASWFGKKKGRQLLKTAEAALTKNPLQTSRNKKDLRPNPFARRQSSIQGRYRVLFNVAEDENCVNVMAVGEKVGEILLVRGKEFTEHHEDNPTE
jgi:mRNA-degrading endonuclease RelE of RelBE toxin-antitoxin system